MFLGVATGVEITPLRVVCGFLMIPLWQVGWAFPLNNPIWSTSLELLLNILHASAFARISRQVLLLAVGVSVLATIPLLDHGHGLEGGPAGGQFGFALLRGLITYPLGVVLWRTWRDQPPFRVPAWATVLAMPTLLSASAAFQASAIADYFFVLAVCPVLIAGGLQITSRWGSLLGAISFPLYAIHDPLIRLALNLDLPAWIGGLTALVLVVAYVQISSAVAARRANRRSDVSNANHMAQALDPVERTYRFGLPTLRFGAVFKAIEVSRPVPLSLSGPTTGW
jgi:peptidoglycan/LPS O-acetylase OafA/YrhL